MRKRSAATELRDLKRELKAAKERAAEVVRECVRLRARLIERDHEIDHLKNTVGALNDHVNTLKQFKTIR